MMPPPLETPGLLVDSPEESTDNSGETGNVGTSRYSVLPPFHLETIVEQGSVTTTPLGSVTAISEKSPDPFIGIGPEVGWSGVTPFRISLRYSKMEGVCEVVSHRPPCLRTRRRRKKKKERNTLMDGWIGRTGLWHGAVWKTSQAITQLTP